MSEILLVCLGINVDNLFKFRCLNRIQSSFNGAAACFKVLNNLKNENYENLLVTSLVVECIICNVYLTVLHT